MRQSFVAILQTSRKVKVGKLDHDIDIPRMVQVFMGEENAIQCGWF
jgi:hypothetical protein